MDFSSWLRYSNNMPNDDVAAGSEPKPKSGRNTALIYLLATLVVLLLGAVGLLVYKIQATPSFTISQRIVQDTPYPIFVPHTLPNGYKIVSNSFALSEEALIFRAEDSTGSTIVFTEQKRPADFNFEQFYESEMENATTLSDTPYPSVTGKSSNGGRLLLSIVTDNTWILASTAAPLNDNDVLRIAKNIKPY